MERGEGTALRPVHLRIPALHLPNKCLYFPPPDSTLWKAAAGLRHDTSRAGIPLGSRQADAVSYGLEIINNAGLTL